MFQEFYNLLSTYIFSGDPSSFAYGELFCQGIATVACALLVLLPFVIVWRIVRKFL